MAGRAALRLDHSGLAGPPTPLIDLHATGSLPATRDARGCNPRTQAATLCVQVNLNNWLARSAAPLRLRELVSLGSVATAVAAAAYVTFSARLSGRRGHRGPHT